MKRMMAALLCVLLCAVGGYGCAETIDERVDRIFTDMKAIGGALIAAKDGEIVFEHYYGIQQKTSKVPVTADTYFRCASVTKLVTGIGLMKLMDEGVLSPDEDISAYLGYTVRNPRYMDTPITLRMLMSHTAQLRENGSYAKLSSRLSDMLDVEKKARTNFTEEKPGSAYTYSNFGAGVTGAILESVTGRDVSSWMREQIFLPLDIDAAYGVHQLAQPEMIATAYRADGSTYQSPKKEMEKAFEPWADPDTHYRTTAGSLYIRPRDLTRLGIMLCENGVLDGKRILSEEAITAMRTPNSKEGTGITEKTPYSFFTIRREDLFEGRTVYGHQGTNEGIVCNLYYEPESRLVLCVMTNGCKSGRDNGIMRITRRLAAEIEKEYLTEPNSEAE